MAKIKGKNMVIGIAVILLLIFLHSLDILNPVESSILKLFSPVEKKLYNAGLKTGKFIENIKQSANQSEIELLKAQIRSLLVQNAKLKILDEENKILKKELEFEREHNFETIAASVIGRDSLQNSTLILLDVEKDRAWEALKPNMPVIAEDGILVGKISSVENNRVFMLPLTASQSAIGATILNKTYTIGVAEGEANLGIRMHMIPKKEEIKYGDLAITSGLETKMPKGILIGTVSKVAEDPQSPFKTAHISPLYDIKRLSRVLIIKSY